MTKILLVEDDASFRETVSSVVLEVGADVSLQVAKSRTSALEILAEESFDILILDLKIPTIDDALDADAEHGRFVFESLNDLARGTPVLILTGSPAETFIDDFLARSTQVDIWGDGKVSTVGFLRKGDVDHLPARLNTFISSIRSISDVEIESKGNINLTWEQSRLIKIFTRRSGGVRCVVERVGGGLSGSDVFKTVISDDRGSDIINCLLKIGTAAMVATEATAYRTYISRLNERATARFIEEIKFGGGNHAAIAYRLAATYSHNMFDVARARPDKVRKVIENIKELTAPWRHDVPQTRITIRELRQFVLSDKKWAKAVAEYDLLWAAEIEKRSVQVRIGCSHCDFHGANILVDNEDQPIIIDYGDVKLAPLGLDWITLELSLLFHKDGCARNTFWPKEDDCRNWFNSKVFSESGDFSSFVCSCRDMATECCVGTRDIAATAYAYLMRQLSYNDTDKPRVLALLNSARQAIEAS